MEFILAFSYLRKFGGFTLKVRQHSNSLIRVVFPIVIIFLLTLTGCSADERTGVSSKDLEYAIFTTEKAEYSIDQVASPEFADKFISHEQPIFNFGLISEIHWIRFRLPDLSSQEDALSEQVLSFDYGLDDIKVFIPVEQANHLVSLQGGFDSYPHNDELAGLSPAFLVPSDYEEAAHGFIRIQTSGSSGFRIDWLDRNLHENIAQNRILLLGSLSGLLLAMALYNFILFLTLRNKQYLYYVLFALSMLLYQSTIVGSIRIAYPPLASIFFEYGQLMSLVAMVLWLLFAYHFLNISENLPRFKPVFFAMIFLAISAVMVNFLIGEQEANIFAYILGLSMPLLAIISAFASRKKGYRVSSFYLAGIVMLFMAVIAFALRGWGIIPHSLVVTYGIFTATSVEAMLYSFALATQIRYLSIENYTLQQQRSELSRISLIDHLTGLYNKRDFNSTYQKEVSRAENDDLPLSLILLDIDLFKGINDTYGHRNGDKVLKRLGLVLKEWVRERGHACRVGGEEFAIILTGTAKEEAEVLAEEIRRAFSEEVFLFEPEKKLNCTISLGVGQLKPGESGNALYDRVDKALYKAKYEGRNRVAAAG